MKVEAQLFSQKGYYGPKISFSVATVADISKALVRAIDELPDTLEGVNVIDWTRINIVIERDHA